MANNIIKRIWNQNTLVNIEVLKGAFFQDEDGGHTFEISGVDNSGNAISLSGTVAGVFLRPDNTDVPITGSASGGIVSVTLPAECYDVPGRFGLTVFVTADSMKTCVYAAIGTVGRTSSGSVAPGTSADVVDLINQISAAVATIPASWSGLMADIAPTYSTSAAYPVGAYVYYNGDLYRCTTAITSGETWTAAHWTTAVLGNDVSDLKNAIERNNTKFFEIDNVIEENKELSDLKAFTLFKYPNEYTGTWFPVNVYSDGEKYITDFKKSDFMQSGGRTLYVNTIKSGAVSTNDGLSPEKPKNLYSALYNAVDGDTIILLEGIYSSTDTGSLTSTLFDKSINIIGIGNVIFCVEGVVYKKLSSKSYDSTNNLWTCTRDAVGLIVSTDLKIKYKQKTSIADCQAEENSWVLSGSTLYINSKFEPDIIIQSVRDGLTIQPTTSRTLYFENIKFVGARWSVLLHNPTNGTLETCFVRCYFTMTFGSYANLRAVSGHHLFVECEASYSSRDGFAYSPGENDDLQFMEIGCYGMNNGLQKTDTQSTSNGSTSHSGAKGIRVNGVYGNNWGANVADVNAGTMTVNLGCTAFDSCGTTSYNEGFSAQQAGATMWLYNCVAHGNIRDLNAVTQNGVNSTIYANDCTFDTMQLTSGQIIITKGPIIPTNADLNDYTKEGTYKCLRRTIAETLGHTPVTDSMFVLQVINMDTVYTMQIIYTTAKIYIRRAFDSTSGSWAAWKSVTLA